MVEDTVNYKKLNYEKLLDKCEKQAKIIVTLMDRQDRLVERLESFGVYDELYPHHVLDMISEINQKEFPLIVGK